MNFIEKIRTNELSTRQISILEITLIVGFAIIPLFSSFPYRVNIFLSWEGAYRLYMGQMPFKDYGIPMGFGYWIIPALFFKLFGPFMSSLIKAQVFINILSGLAFRSILKTFSVQEGLRVVSILLFVISYSFFNFWPWYNHSVIVYEFIGLSFLLKFIFRKQTNWKHFGLLLLGTLCLFLSFYTKQDGGGLAFLIALFILIYHAIIDKKYLDLVYFLAFYGLWISVFIFPFLSHDFGYWFNMGQEPHNSRVALWDFVNTAFSQSKWEKFYLCGMILVLFVKAKDLRAFITDKKEFLFYLFTLGILVEALLFQVTSYTPPDNNIFFHSFAFVYLFSLSAFTQSLKKIPNLAAMLIIIMLWWSGAYWKYVERIAKRMFPAIAKVDENKISKNTFMIASDRMKNNVGMEKWGFSELKAFKKVYMPQSTVDGMKRLMEMEAMKKDDKKVLNMTELTPLAHEAQFELEKNRPLWYHKGVGMFQREVDLFVDLVEDHYYDVVLFEDIPYLNNFFPYEVRDKLLEKYELADKFLAPRRPTDSYIEVYVPKKIMAQDSLINH